MKKVLHIVEAFGGGVYNYVRDCANWQAEKYEVTIAFCMIEKTPSGFMGQFDQRVRFVEMTGCGRSMNPLKNLKAIDAIREIAHKLQPDVIHLHSSFAGFWGRLAVNGDDIPLFYSPHAYGFVMQNATRFERKLYLWLEKIAGKRSCITVCDCMSEYDESKTVTSKSVCINNGIDICELEETVQKLRVTPSGVVPTVFMMGRICAQKNPAQFNRLAQRFPEIPFLWIGDGEAAALLTSPNIKVTGWVSREEAIAYALGCDIFLFTTLWESLSLALLECLYLRKICITMDAEGNRDVIKNGVNGFLCYSDDDMEKALSKVLSGGVDWVRLVENAHDDVVREYNTEMKNTRLSALYQNPWEAVQRQRRLADDVGKISYSFK
ncbi:glycosyltransferase [Oscillospiraceae bacterium CM]|nr:glycosyltransferase [Oscillospiraceae bacterium CM]